jgi:hypothetical protein
MPLHNVFLCALSCYLYKKSFGCASLCSLLCSSDRLVHWWLLAVVSHRDVRLLNYARAHGGLPLGCTRSLYRGWFWISPFHRYIILGVTCPLVIHLISPNLCWGLITFLGLGNVYLEHRVLLVLYLVSFMSLRWSSLTCKCSKIRCTMSKLTLRFARRTLTRRAGHAQVRAWSFTQGSNPSFTHVR